MAYQWWSALHVAFTRILYGTNFHLIRYEAKIHKLDSDSFSEHIHDTFRSVLIYGKEEESRKKL